MRTLAFALITVGTMCPGLAQSQPFVPLVNVPGAGTNLPGISGAVADGAGDVFFASGAYSAYSVLRWDAKTGALTSVAGNGTPGFSGDGGPATSAQLNGATDLALDSAGNLYIADSYNFRVRKVSNGVITTVAGGGTSYPGCDNCPATNAFLDELDGIAVDPAGNLYIFDSGIVRKVSNGVVTTFLGYGSPYPDAGIHKSGTALADSAGNLYVADSDSEVIRKISNGVVSTVAGSGMTGFSGDNGPATSAQLAGPRGIALDSAGNLYIADTGNQRIRKVSNGVITTVAGGGSPSGGLGDNGPATSGLLNYPFGIAVDAAGNLYIEDTLDLRLRKVANGVITTVAGGGSNPVLRSQSAGAFAATGSMGTARLAHTATLLNNGKVLIAGGYTYGPQGNGGAVTASELYDPATGTFAPAGSMTAALQDTKATLLADGRVLIVGAPPPYDYERPAVAELYDSAAGGFAGTGGLQKITQPVTATLLNNGKVLVTGTIQAGGGFFGPPQFSYYAELYDPASGTFAATGTIRTDHLAPTATLLADGQVFIAEGTCSNEFGSNSVGSEVYDPSTGSFSPVAGTMTCRAEPTATLLANGKVLIQGGLGAGAAVYDPRSQTFLAGAGINDYEYEDAATLLPDGTVLISGGNPTQPGSITCPTDTIADSGLYDPSSGAFGLAALMTTPRDLHQATLLPDGTVLVSGGEHVTSSSASPLASAEIYTPPVPLASPKLFSISGDGKGQGAIWHTNTGEVASADRPATSGDVLSLYTSGLIEGGAVPPRIAIGGTFAELVFFGDAPGYPGYFQVNLRMPAGILPASAVPVRLTYFDRPSNEVTLAVN